MRDFKYKPLAVSVAAILLSGMPDLLQANENSNNKLVLEDEKNYYDVAGGRSENGAARNNSVIIGEKAQAYSVIGGTSNRSEAVDNRVTVEGLAGMAIGGQGGTYSAGDVRDNIVTVDGGYVGIIYGATSNNRDAVGNSVVVKNGTAASATGGHANSTFHLLLEQMDNDQEKLYARYGSDAGLIIDGVDRPVHAIGNTVEIDNSAVYEVIGGTVSNAFGNTAVNNTVTIKGDTKFLSEVPEIKLSFAPGVEVDLFKDVEMRQGIFGGFNDVFFEEGFAGVQEKGGDIFTGNTLNFSASPVSVKTVANFEHYNFHLDPQYANTNTALIEAEDIGLGYDPSKPSKVQVVGVKAGQALAVDDGFVLMQATNSMQGYGEGLTSKGIAQQGIAVLYDIATTVDVDGKIITAKVLGQAPEVPEVPSNPGDSSGSGGSGEPEEPSKPGGGTDPENPSIPLIPLEPSKPVQPAGRINPQLKALSEGYIAGAMLVNRGADAIAYDALDAIDAQNNQSGLASFVSMSGSRTRYNSGSHVKSNEATLSTGLSFQKNNVTLGAFLETGSGSYDSYNSFSNAAKVHGDGSTRYYGAGVLGRYIFDSNVYTDASVRFGRTRTKFDTSDIQNLVTGEKSKYNVRSNYASAHVGAGYILSFDQQNSLDVSVKYLRSTLDGAKTEIAGDTIDFKRVDSERVRTDAVFTHDYSETVKFKVGIGYEYEFDSKAKATARTAAGDLSIDAPDVKGGTGIFSLGATVKPSANQNLSLDFNVNGYTGKREGAGASIRAGYAF